MQIDKIIKREVISLIVSIILILLIFIGVSFASFFVVKEGLANTVSFGDISLKLCRNTTCNDEVSEYGQVIGLQDNGSGSSVPTKVYPFASTSEALQSTPYVFNMKNDGNYKLYVNAFLMEDEDFKIANSLYNNTAYSYMGLNSSMVSGTYDFTGYSNAVSSNGTSLDYSKYIKIGIADCTEGMPENREENTQVYSFSNLIDDKILDNVELENATSKTYCLWTWLDEHTPNSIQNSYFVAKISLEGSYKPFYKNLREQIITDSSNQDCSGAVCYDNVSSVNVTSLTGIDFSLPSSNENGKGLYHLYNTNNQEKGKDVYYFRGEVDNNYVLYNGSCYRIIRTNENGGVKLMYYGESSDGTTCNNITDDSVTAQYNETDNDNMFVGFKHGVKDGLLSEETFVASPSTPYTDSNSLITNTHPKKPSEPEHISIPLISTNNTEKYIDASYMYYYSPSYDLSSNGQFTLSQTGIVQSYWGREATVSSTEITYGLACNIGSCPVMNFYTCFSTDSAASCDTLYKIVGYYSTSAALVKTITFASTSYDNATTNTNNSKIYSTIQSWYDTKLPVDTQLDSYQFCNDRTIGNNGTVDGVEYRTANKPGEYVDVLYKPTITSPWLTDSVFKSSGGYAKYYTLYAAARRLMTNGNAGTALGSASTSPTYKCINPNDELSTSNSLTKSIGIITADEAVYAGASYNQATNSFIKTTHPYWTMTPSRFTTDGTNDLAKVFTIDSTGKLLDTTVTDLNTYYYPVISLSSSVSASSGNGTASTPYIIN